MSAFNGKSRTAPKDSTLGFVPPHQNHHVSVPMPNGQVQSNNVLSGSDLMGLAQQNYAGQMGLNQQDNAHVREIVEKLENSLGRVLASFERQMDENTDGVIEGEFEIGGH